MLIISAKGSVKRSPIGARFTEAVKAVSGSGISLTLSPGLVVIPAKGFGKMLLICARSTENLVSSFS